MTSEPSTFDVNFVFDLAQRPTLEEELHMEKEIRIGYDMEHKLFCSLLLRR